MQGDIGESICGMVIGESICHSFISVAMRTCNPERPDGTPSTKMTLTPGRSSLAALPHVSLLMLITRSQILFRFSWIKINKKNILNGLHCSIYPFYPFILQNLYDINKPKNLIIFQGLLSRDSLMTRRSSAFPGAEWTAMSSRMRSPARHRTSVGSSTTVPSLGLRYSDMFRVLKVEIELLVPFTFRTQC